MAKKEILPPVSQPEKVDAFMAASDHPMLEEMKALRTMILSANKEIGEEIKWNAPSFFYTGTMAPFDPKDYKRDIVVFNLFKKECIRLIFPTGAKVQDSSGLLGGKFTDGRKMAEFHNMAELKAQEKNLKAVLNAWISLVEK